MWSFWQHRAARERREDFCESVRLVVWVMEMEAFIGRFLSIWFTGLKIGYSSNDICNDFKL